MLVVKIIVWHDTSNMKRAVYVGGFSSGRTSAERVAGMLEHHYDDVALFTFSEAMRRPTSLYKAMLGAHAITHSAGMLPLRDSRPETITAFSPPMPTSVLKLCARSGVKIFDAHTPHGIVPRRNTLTAIGANDASSAAELALHPHGNFGHLGEVSVFNAVTAAIKAQAANIPTTLAYTAEDEFFRPAQHDMFPALAAGVQYIRLPGIHDELILRPTATWQALQEALSPQAIAN